MGAASCGAASTQALVRRRGRDSPQSAFHQRSRESMRHGATKEKLIVFMMRRKNINVKGSAHAKARFVPDGGSERRRWRQE